MWSPISRVWLALRSFGRRGNVYLGLGEGEEEQKEGLDLPVEWKPVRLYDVSPGGKGVTRE